MRYGVVYAWIFQIIELDMRYIYIYPFEKNLRIIYACNTCRAVKFKSYFIRKFILKFGAARIIYTYCIKNIFSQQAQSHAIRAIYIREAFLGISIDEYWDFQHIKRWINI